MIGYSLTITPDNGTATSTSTLGVTCTYIEPVGTQIDTYVNWGKSAHQPIYMGQNETWTEVAFKFLITGTSRSNADIKASNLISAMMKSNIAPSGWDYTLKGHVEGAPKYSWANEKTLELDVTFMCRKLCTSQSISFTSTASAKTINGNAQVPCKFTLTVSNASSSSGWNVTVSVDGNAVARIRKPLGQSLTVNSYIVIDGSTGAIYTTNNLSSGTKTNIADFYDLPELPSILGGSRRISYSTSNITCSSATLDVTGRYL